jgi:hypothetical protein
VVEQYESFIWTERYSDQGDFVLEIDPRVAEAGLFNQGTMLVCDKSSRVMVTDTVQEATAEDGNRVLKITGPSLESIMDQRPNQYGPIVAGAASSSIILGGASGTGGFGATPKTIMTTLFEDVLATNVAFSNADRLPFIVTGPYSSTVNMIPEPTATPIIQTELDTLYNTIKSLADIYRLGFRLIRPAEDSKLYFEVYTGYDRTTSQSTNVPVVFSTEFDNLTDTRELVSTAGYKNVAYVYAPNGSRVVYGENASSSTSGLNRKVLIVMADDITDAAGAGLNTKLDQRGLEELAKTRPTRAFDGKIAQSPTLRYGVDYALGDLVEQRSDKGTRNIMKVTEQIFVSDKEGERSYPTLTLDSLIVAGSWDSILASKHWNDYTTETWNQL